MTATVEPRESLIPVPLRRSLHAETLRCLPGQQWEPAPASPDQTSYQELQAKATLSRDGKAWAGPFVMSNYMADGTQIFTGPGTMEARRIELKPLP
jgi:hypothetical protein